MPSRPSAAFLTACSFPFSLRVQTLPIPPVTRQMVSQALPSDTTVPILRLMWLTRNNLKGRGKLNKKDISTKEVYFSLSLFKMGSTRADFCGGEKNHPLYTSLTRALLLRTPHTLKPIPASDLPTLSPQRPAVFFTTLNAAWHLSFMY